MSSRTVPEYDDLDNYAVEDIDDPFQSPPPEPKDGSVNKRKKAEALGLDEEIEVAKRVRVPRVKLDEARLLSENGIPKLRKRAADLKFKGKGHEFSDAARLLSFYQLWLDDLFPKAKFLDALAMVEKAGHKKQIALKRMEWINEGKPKPWEADGDVPEENDEASYPPAHQATSAQALSSTTGQRPTTPGGDVPDEDDIYGSTPAVQARGRKQERARPAPNDPDNDDLDALMAEADAATQMQVPAREPGGDDFADEEAAMAEMDGLW